MQNDHIPYHNIDCLQSLELQGAALPYGVKSHLFQAAKDVHDRPMVLAAAEILDRQPSRVGIVTGAQVPEKMPRGENDGPLGSVVLARALCEIGHTVTIYTDDAAAAAIEELIDWMELDATVHRLPQDSSDVQTEIAAQLDITIAVERLGSNPNGILYGATGVSRSDFRCNMDSLFSTAADLGRPTIGIADGGNEIGCGKIHAEICATMPMLNYRERTPCGGGVFSVVSTDVLVIATSSNLGCSGVVAALALRRSMPELCHKAEAERALIAKGVELGLTDGGTGQVIDAVDGIPASDHAAVVGLMESIVRRALSTPQERGF